MFILFNGLGYFGHSMLMPLGTVGPSAFERMKKLPIEVSEKMSADEKMSLRKMILEMEGTSIALPGLGFVTVLFLILSSEAYS